MRSENLHVMIECTLDAEYFDDWDELSPEMQRWWQDQKETPHCEGSGLIDLYCRNCPFCGLIDSEVDT